MRIQDSLQELYRDTVIVMENMKKVWGENKRITKMQTQIYFINQNPLLELACYLWNVKW